MEIVVCRKKSIPEMRIIRNKETREALCMICKIQTLEDNNIIEHVQGEHNPQHYMAIYADGSYFVDSNENRLMQTMKMWYRDMDYIWWEKHEKGKYFGRI